MFTIGQLTPFIADAISHGPGNMKNRCLIEPKLVYGSINRIRVGGSMDEQKAVGALEKYFSRSPDMCRRFAMFSACRSFLLMSLKDGRHPSLADRFSSLPASPLPRGYETPRAVLKGQQMCLPNERECAWPRSRLHIRLLTGEAKHCKIKYRKDHYLVRKRRRNMSPVSPLPVKSLRLSDNHINLQDKNIQDAQ
jgi:hypothetical protein